MPIGGTPGAKEMTSGSPRNEGPAGGCRQGGPNGLMMIDAWNVDGIFLGNYIYIDK